MYCDCFLFNIVFLVFIIIVLYFMGKLNTYIELVLKISETVLLGLNIYQLATYYPNEETHHWRGFHVSMVMN